MMLIVIRIMNTNQIFIKIFGEFGKNLNSFNEVIWIDCFLFWNSHSCKRQKDKKNTVANLHDCTKAWKKQTQTQTIRCKVQLIIAWLLKLKLNYSWSDTSGHYLYIFSPFPYHVANRSITTWSIPPTPTTLNISAGYSNNLLHFYSWSERHTAKGKHFLQEQWPKQGLIHDIFMQRTVQLKSSHNFPL